MLITKEGILYTVKLSGYLYIYERGKVGVSGGVGGCERLD